MGNIYCEASLPRAGLANKLFAWARCRVYSRIHSAPMLAPRWVQTPIGPLLRRERDLRIYNNLFIGRDDDVRGFERARVRMFAERFGEPARLGDSPPETDGPGLIVFSGLGEQFEPLIGWQELIRNELRAITRPRWLESASVVADRSFIGIHVRRGDFRLPARDEMFCAQDNLMTPIEWFVDSLREVRGRMRAPIPAIVASDGNEEELAPLLAESNIRFVTTKSAIGDLWLLSSSRLLLASGSSFSAWAAYLGQMPTLTHPGLSLKRLFRLDGAPGAFVENPEDLASLR